VPLAQLVVRQLRRLAAEHGGGKSLHDAKLLQFAQPFLAETCWRASGFNALVLSLLAPCISSPFKQLREELSRTLVIIFCNLRFGAATAADATATVVAEAERFFSLPSLTATDPMEVEAEKGSSAEDTSHARETFLVVLSNAVRRAASAAIIPHAHRLIRLLFASFGDKDRDTVNVAKQTAALAAQLIVLDGSSLWSLLEQDLLALPRPDTLWHIRAAMLPFLQIFAFNHQFLLNENQRKQIREFVISLLSDPSVEVRELASVCLSSLLHGEESSVVEALAPRFLSALGRLVRRRDAKGESAPEERPRHGAALGLAALIRSEAYTVPGWLPPLLVNMAPYEEDAQSSVREAIKRSFAEFHRTHQEAWELHQEAFTEEQLDVVMGLGKTSTTYYL